MAETNLLNLKRGLNGVSKTKYIKDTKNSKPKKATKVSRNKGSPTDVKARKATGETTE